MERAFLTLLALLTFLALAAVNASAQGWPAKPIRAIVPVGAGSSTDIVHRLVLEQLSSQLGRGGDRGKPSARRLVVPQRWPNSRTVLAFGTAQPPPRRQELGLPPGARFCRGRADRHFAGRVGLAREGNQERRGARCGRQGAAERAQLLLGRHRHGDAPQRGTVPGERGHPGGSHTLQGRREAMTKSSPAAPTSFSARWPRASTYSRWQARGAGGKHRQALGGPAAGADDARSRSATPNIRSGSACSRRPGRRARSSSGFIAKP